MRYRILVRSLLTLCVAVGLTFGQSQVALAVGAAVEDAPTANAAASEAEREDFYALKSRLDASDSGFTRTATPVTGGTEYTYVHRDGVVLALAVPSAKPGGPSADLRAAGCGFLQVCVYFNRTDQGALLAGSTAALATAICAIPAVGTVGCAFVVGAVAAAAFYVNENGRCPNELQVRVFPSVGKIECV